MRLMTMTLAAIAALSTGWSGMASAETLRVSSFLPPNHTFNRAIEAWGEELSAATNGELQVEIFPAGQLGPPPRQFDLVRSGGADIAIILHGATPGRFPMTELAGLPLTHPSAGLDSAITSRRLTELAPDYLAAEHEGTHILWMAVTPPLKIHLTTVDPSDLSNLSGLRIRYAGSVWQQIIEAMGASPVPVPPAESADAMSRGIVDGASFPFEAAQAFDLAPVTQYSMEPGLASATFALVMGDAAYDRLTPEQQAAIDATTGPDRAEWYGARWDEGETAGRQYMVDAGVNIVTLSDEQIGSLTEAFSGIVSQAVETVGGQAQAFVDAYTE
ncbi:TRAP transporter substrate-binding protein [Rhodobacter sp. NTK016B]|uniref:TRAP transporter substrate-binding protein n=1 Tax=Rhodobacter sp. NTK016B TaxID=2759676 RepID=UPI001A8CD881|nr:TRAP transporter substrate-binding protein [Rhodobacter sp. NTK016B]MBN8293396.1 TRAP transporter substrate-binding protein [Rhodobacter sp. NTK016B]